MELYLGPNTPVGGIATAADDGKHAFSVIEVETSLLEAKGEGGVEGGERRRVYRACG